MSKYLQPDDRSFDGSADRQSGRSRSRSNSSAGSRGPSPVGLSLVFSLAAATAQGKYVCPSNSTEISSFQLGGSVSESFDRSQAPGPGQARFEHCQQEKRAPYNEMGIMLTIGGIIVLATCIGGGFHIYNHTACGARRLGPATAQVLTIAYRACSDRCARRKDHAATEEEAWKLIPGDAEVIKVSNGPGIQQEVANHIQNRADYGGVTVTPAGEQPRLE